MNTEINDKTGSIGSKSDDQKSLSLFQMVENSIYKALQTYSNVHRGSGHFSRITTAVYDHARDIVLDYLGLPRRQYVIIFCTARRASSLLATLDAGSYQIISSHDIGLPLGINAVAVKKGRLPRGMPFQTGGGTARLTGPTRVIWGAAPDKFEAGTPSIINVIAFARALLVMKFSGISRFNLVPEEKISAEEILYKDDFNAFNGKELLDHLRASLIGLNTEVPTASGNKPFINLDNAASTPTFDPIWQSYCKAIKTEPDVREEVVMQVKKICAEILNASSDEYDILFTSNTTEGINLVADYLKNDPIAGEEPVVINTMLEHNSNDLPWRTIPGVELIRLQVDKNGIMDIAGLERMLSAFNHENLHGNRRIRLVSLSGASNVLGIYNDLKAISLLVHRFGARLMVDAAQMVAHRRVDMAACDMDYLVFSAHKVYAPFGTGVLVMRKELLKINSREQKLIRMSGEANIGGIAALGKSLLLLRRIGYDAIQDHEHDLLTRILKGTNTISGIKILGPSDPGDAMVASKGAVVAFEMKGLMANKVAQELAVRGGIGIRAGCHCAHILVKYLIGITPILEKIQYLIISIVPGLTLPGVARISLGIENTRQEIEVLLTILAELAQKKRITDDGSVKKIERFVMMESQRVYEPG